MTENVKSYSVLIAWSDSDLEQGDYAATVRAPNADAAEALVRALMADSVSDDKKTGGFGRLIECSEGAIWHAADLEKALRALKAVAVWDADSDRTAFDAAMAFADNVLADIDRAY
ncbi:hypothetical protein [Mesorhizobium sp. 128a]